MDFIHLYYSFRFSFWIGTVQSVQSIVHSICWVHARFRSKAALIFAIPISRNIFPCFPFYRILLLLFTSLAIINLSQLATVSLAQFVRPSLTSTLSVPSLTSVPPLCTTGDYQFRPVIPHSKGGQRALRQATILIWGRVCEFGVKDEVIWINMGTSGHRE